MWITGKTLEDVPQAQAAVDVRRRKLIAATGIGLLAGISSHRADALGGGEWFTLGIAGHLSQPRLLEGQLSAINSKIAPIERVGAFFSYTRQDNLKVPEAVVFRWRAEGDAEPFERIIRVRSRLPEDVLQKLSTLNRTFKLGLQFRVRDGRPEVLWRLVDLDGPRGRRIDPIAEGLVAPE